LESPVIRFASPVAAAVVVIMLALPGTDQTRAASDPSMAAAALPAETADSARGQELFTAVGCLLCHAVDGRGGDLGPDLTGIGARPSRDPERWPTTREYIRSSIRAPHAFIVPGYTAIMPGPETFGLDEQDVEYVVAYLASLRGERAK
jgi:mono/diheme cytochrome c family protein